MPHPVAAGDATARNGQIGQVGRVGHFGLTLPAVAGDSLSHSSHIPAGSRAP